jgi:hypothetical protein
LVQAADAAGPRWRLCRGGSEPGVIAGVKAVALLVVGVVMAVVVVSRVVIVVGVVEARLIVVYVKELGTIRRL